MTDKSPYARFMQQRANARHRGIRFLLTFEQWWSIWRRSRRYAERGRGRYVMARYRDSGPYAVGNVRIITYKSNVREAWACKSADEVQRWKQGIAKGGYATRGRKRPDVTALNKSRAGQPLSARHRKNIAAGMLGKIRGRYKTWKGLPR
jgi:hypothetical protein